VVLSRAGCVGCRFPLLCCSRDCVFVTRCLEFCAGLADSACNDAGAWIVAMKVLCEVMPDENLLEKGSLLAGSSPKAGLDFVIGEGMFAGWATRFGAIFLMLTVGGSRLL
jgi:hypothetical protein